MKSYIAVSYRLVYIKNIIFLHLTPKLNTEGEKQGQRGGCSGDVQGMPYQQEEGHDRGGQRNSCKCIHMIDGWDECTYVNLCSYTVAGCD